MDENSIMQAIEGSDFVVHTASPFPIVQPKDEDELIKPAVNGTLAVMKACRKNKVKRVVITSSCAAISPCGDKTNFNEKDWADVENAVAYSKSKILAEKAAWDFVKDLPEKEKFEVVTINPGLVIGPNLNKAQFSSGDIIKKLMMKEMPACPKMSLAMVDVRDVAQAHLEGIKKPDAAGRRFILVEKTYWMHDLARVLSWRFAKDGYPVPTSVLPYPVAWVLSLFRDDMTYIIKAWGRIMTYDNSKTK